MITIVDYGMGNLKSIQNMLKKVGAESVITSDLTEVENAKKIILPGVGSFDTAIMNIEALGLKPVLNKLVLDGKVPIFGICLGMQIMCNSSEEGHMDGFGWIDAEVKKFSFEKGSDLKVPHMGWNVVHAEDGKDLFKDCSEEELRFYHVHSYYVKLNDEEDQLATTNYSFEFTSGFRKNNIVGVQFHPEKSHSFGMQMFRNFSSL